MLNARYFDARGPCCHSTPISPLSDQVRQFLSAHHLRLNTDLGQHFLVDEDVLESIISAAAIQSNDHIVEIGPGVGVLTKRLLEKAEEVTAIELDDRLIPLLKDFVKNDPKLTVVHANALKAELPNEPYKIVANIPYHITSPLLRHACMESPLAPTSLTLLIQREVAEKICDTKHAGLLTIIVGLFGTPKLIRKVPPGCFLPPPAVDSAVLHIDCHKNPIADAETMEKVMSLAKLGFGQKRKMLSNTIGSLPDGTERLEKAGVDPKRRPETLTIGEWIRLATV